MSNVYQMLSSMAKFDAEDRAFAAAFVGPKTAKPCDCRVGDIIDFRDRFNGNRYTGKVIRFGDDIHAGSLQMRVQVYSFNGQYAPYTSNCQKGCDELNVTAEEVIAVLKRGK